MRPRTPIESTGLTPGYDLAGEPKWVGNQERVQDRERAMNRRGLHLSFDRVVSLRTRYSAQPEKDEDTKGAAGSDWASERRKGWSSDSIRTSEPLGLISDLEPG